RAHSVAVPGGTVDSTRWSFPGFIKWHILPAHSRRGGVPMGPPWRRPHGVSVAPCLPGPGQDGGEVRGVSRRSALPGSRTAGQRTSPREVVARVPSPARGRPLGGSVRSPYGHRGGGVKRASAAMGRRPGPPGAGAGAACAHHGPRGVICWAHEDGTGGDGRRGVCTAAGAEWLCEGRPG